MILIVSGCCEPKRISIDLTSKIPVYPQIDRLNHEELSCLTDDSKAKVVLLDSMRLRLTSVLESTRN